MKNLDSEILQFVVITGAIIVLSLFRILYLLFTRQRSAKKIDGVSQEQANEAIEAVSRDLIALRKEIERNRSIISAQIDFLEARANRQTLDINLNFESEHFIAELQVIVPDSEIAESSNILYQQLHQYNTILGQYRDTRNDEFGFELKRLGKNLIQSCNEVVLPEIEEAFENKQMWSVRARKPSFQETETKTETNG